MPLPFHNEECQLEILGSGTREQLIAWLKWNDANGIWTDEDSEAEDKHRLTLDEARRWMRKGLSTIGGIAQLATLPKNAEPATCREWLRLVCWQFGLGFHLDTPADDYRFDDGTTLSTEVASDLNSAIERVFQILGEEEPYEVCADEFEAIIAMTWSPAIRKLNEE